MATFLSPLKTSVLFVIILFSTTNLFAQQNSKYSLLWKISGKGLSKPSYLFGTMHVKDKRVFNFSDSVMLSLQSCSRFALEAHPDTLIQKMFAILQRDDSSRSIAKMFSKEQYKQLEKKFQGKTGMPLGKIDPIALESAMEEKDKTDDKVTFIDAYLYGIARTLNKDIYGLEDAGNQMDEYFDNASAVKERILDLLDDDVQTVQDENKEDMTNVYSTGDLDAIYQYILKNSVIDSSIIARNKVMASSMIKYMADDALFTAVGVAHLPGPDGVIALLRNAGYTVTCVKAAFTGVASNYHIDYMKMNWNSVRDNAMGYSISFPGNPIRNKIYGIDNLLYPDLANGLYYGIYNVPRGTADGPANWKEVMNKVVENIKKKHTSVLLSRKDIVFDKLPCAELLVKNSTGYMRMRFLLANNTLYSFYAGGKSGDLTQPLTEKFLNSFEWFPVERKPIGPWITYTNGPGAFSVKMPGVPIPVIKDVPAKISEKTVTFKLNMYVSTDTVHSISYLVRYNDYPEGVFLSNSSSVFDLLMKDFTGKGKLVGQPVKIAVDGYEGREFKAILNGGFNSTFRLFVKGNRIYVLLKEVIQPDLADPNPSDPFFDSFTLNAPLETDYYTYHADTNSYQLKMPVKPVVSTKNTSYTNYLKYITTCVATNPNTGAVYLFEHARLSPYFRIETTDSLYRKLIKNYRKDKQDSVVKVDTITIDGAKGREVIMQNKDSGSKERMRICLNNDELFILSGHMSNAEYFDKCSEVYFNSLKLGSNHSYTENLAGSKAEKLCADLSSTDTLVSKNALGALSFYDFNKSELPFVYASLRKSYPDDTSSSGVRGTLINKVSAFPGDTATDVLTKLYPTFKEKDELKAAVLSAVTQLDKKQGYDIYLKLLSTDPPLKASSPFDVFSPLQDSVEFAAAHFDQLLPFVKNENFRGAVLALFRKISNEKNAAYDKKIKANYQTIMAFAMDDIKSYIAIKDSSDNKWGGRLYNYFQLISKVPFEPVNDKLTTYYLDRDGLGSYGPDAVVARINNHLPNKPLLVNKYLDSIGTRYDLMEAFDSQKQLFKVPLKYRQQAEYAKLCFHQYISTDDYGAPEKLKLLGSIVKNGSVYYLFKFELSQMEEGKTYIGITGPYKMGSAKLNFDKYFAFTAYDYLKPNWRLQGQALIKPLIEAYK